MRIDVHTHLTSRVYLSTIRDLGGFDELSTFNIMRKLCEQRLSPTALSTDETLEPRVAEMASGGVDLQVLSLGAAQPYFEAEHKAVTGARTANDLFRQAMNSHPAHFSAFGILPLPHVDASIAEIGRCLDDLGFAGINLACSARGIPLDDPIFEPVWAELNARKAVVHLHPGVAIDGIVGCLEHHLAPDFVSPAEIGVAVARMIVSGLTTRFPDVSIILATTGGSLPFFAQRYDAGLLQEDPERYEELGGFAHHLRGFYYDTSVLQEPLVLKTGAERFGADRLMLGSDIARPAITSNWAVSYIQDAEFLSEADKRLILDVNAFELLRDRLPQEAIDAAAARNG